MDTQEADAPTADRRDDGLASVRTALQRVETVLRRRPDIGLHDDAPATVRWSAGTRVVARHANGTEIPTDMPTELGGAGDHVTPGWLFRAGLASCAATCIAMKAAADGVALATLEVQARSRSDTRGLLAMADEHGGEVPAGPVDVSLSVRIGAAGVVADRLRTLVDAALRCSPIPVAVRSATPVALSIVVDGT
jgi:uncharacterized OsmC-like protein